MLSFRLSVVFLLLSVAFVSGKILKNDNKHQLVKPLPLNTEKISEKVTENTEKVTKETAGTITETVKKNVTTKRNETEGYYFRLAEHLLMTNITTTVPVCSRPVVRSEQYVAMCLIVKEDHLDIVEWIEYHKRLGVSKFYIHDHNSTVPLLETIREYVLSGLVEYSFAVYRGIAKAQMHVYRECLKNHGKKHTFMGFIDSDEFIVVGNKTQTIPDVLRNYEKFGGLTLNWRVYGSSGHVTRPKGAMINKYSKCYNNHHVKTIVNTQYVKDVAETPHSFDYIQEPDCKQFAVDTNKIRIPLWFNPPHTVEALPPASVYKIMHVNHYETKSREDYDHKLARGRKVNGSKVRPANYFEEVDAKANKTCPILYMPNKNLHQKTPNHAVKPTAKPVPAAAAGGGGVVKATTATKPAVAASVAKQAAVVKPLTGEATATKPVIPATAAVKPVPAGGKPTASKGKF